MAVDGDIVASGYFSFSSSLKLVRHLTQQRGDFIGAINRYHEQLEISLVQANDWFDFGHLNAYFNSRAAFTTQRSFNALEINRSTARKSSHKVDKMEGEANWFEALPNDIQIYSPKLLSRFNDGDRAGYSLEYLYNLPLSDLFVFGHLAKASWRRIFQSCHRFLARCKAYSPESSELHPTDIDSLYLPKTLDRLEQFAIHSGVDIDKPIHLNGTLYPSPRDIAEQSSERIPAATLQNVAIVHGDFCFSNILYDFRTRRIKVIDPRGIDAQGRPTLYGDSRYDYAKLYHSVHGLYDLIIAGRLKAKQTDSGLELRDYAATYHLGINQAFNEVFFSDQPQLQDCVQAIGVQLFLSMLPLHNDQPERQMTMLANAYRLYAELQGEQPCS
ncbi:phosphotransferase [Motiliproteus sp.]|uniref:phosphotransferase n=1 Tax=Motiliproteus sp. TaxID=1898955 RepID=UPI003BA922C9